MQLTEDDSDKTSTSTPKLACKKCGQKHTAPTGKSSPGHSTTPSQGSSKLELMLRDAIFMVLDLCELGVNDNWDGDAARLFEEAVGYFSQYVEYVGPHEPETGGPMKKLITKLEESCGRLKKDREDVKEILQRQICALKVIECKIYSTNADPEVIVADDAQQSNETREEDDNNEGNGTTNSAEAHTVRKKKGKQKVTVLAPLSFKLRNKAEGKGMLTIVANRAPNATTSRNDAAERLDSYHGMRADDVTKAFDFDARYHYRKANKCSRCMATSIDGKDCFFPLSSSSASPRRGDAEDRCTHCKRVRYKCYMVHESLYEEKPPIPVEVPLARTATTASPAPTAAAPSEPAPAVAPLRLVQASATAPLSTRAAAVESVHKRKAISESSSSNRIKQRRTSSNVDADVVAGSASSSCLVSKDDMLHQTSRLNISFESFTDLSRRQVQSDRKHGEQEATSEELKVAYEESRRVAERKRKEYEESRRACEERKREFEEDEQRREESERVCAATREWLAARSEWAGENLIEEATELLSSIEKGPAAVKHIAPALQRLWTAFDEFRRVQNELVEAHRFRGERAEHLYVLMERIRAGEIPVEGTSARR